MTRLLSSLAQIALLRSDPGVLPASGAWVVAIALAYAVTNAVMAWVDGSQRILARTAVDLVLSLAFFGLLLAMTRRMHRFAQTANAVLGVYLLFAPAMTALLLLHGPSKSNYGIWVLTTAGSTLVTIWYLLAVGHILKCALDTGLVTGFAIAVTWALASLAVAQILFGLPT